MYWEHGGLMGRDSGPGLRRGGVRPGGTAFLLSLAFTVLKME